VSICRIEPNLVPGVDWHGILQCYGILRMKIIKSCVFGALQNTEKQMPSVREILSVFDWKNVFYPLLSVSLFYTRRIV